MVLGVRDEGGAWILVEGKLCHGFLDVMIEGLFLAFFEPLSDGE